MSDIYDTAEWRAWVEAVRTRPDDDNVRLFAADWLEERGEGERAELIRVAIASYRMDVGPPPYTGLETMLVERDRIARKNCVRWWGDAAKLFYLRSPPDEPYTFDGGWVKRGFVERVSGPLAVLHGGRCRTCSGRGRGRHESLDGTFPDCPVCDATGWTATGVLGRLLRAEPVTTVVVTDREPHDFTSHPDGPFWCWTYSPDWERLTCLPEQVYRLCNKRYPTRDLARSALSAALLALHRPQPSPAG